eukprot:gene7372-495_t
MKNDGIGKRGTPGRPGAQAPMLSPPSKIQKLRRMNLAQSGSSPSLLSFATPPRSGIKGLTKLLNDEAAGCCKEQKFESYFGRKFMVVVGRQGDQLLTNEAGETTSHILGMFYRTVRMLEAGIKPVYVFDGKPPELKTAMLASRSDRRGAAEEGLKAAQESGNAEDIEKFSKRTIRAPSEAEAQCSTMAASGVVYAIATEDMDALTFGAPRVIRHLMASGAANLPVLEFNRETALTFNRGTALTFLEFNRETALTQMGLTNDQFINLCIQMGLTNDQFIDLCILCGCDYAQNIRGIGPVRALQLIKKHETIEAVIDSLDSAKYPLPEPFPYKVERAAPGPHRERSPPDPTESTLPPDPTEGKAPRTPQRGKPPGSHRERAAPRPHRGVSPPDPTEGEAPRIPQRAYCPHTPQRAKPPRPHRGRSPPDPSESVLPPYPTEGEAPQTPQKKKLVAARDFFKDPEVLKTEQLPPLKWTDPDTDGLVSWLVGEKGFQEDRVRNGIKKIISAKGKGTQGRMESYFQLIQKPPSAHGSPPLCLQISLQTLSQSVLDLFQVIQKPASAHRYLPNLSINSPTLSVLDLFQVIQKPASAMKPAAKDVGKGKRAAGKAGSEPAAKKGKSGVGGGKKK